MLVEDDKYEEWIEAGESEFHAVERMAWELDELVWQGVGYL
ncbi:hypothetical protein ES702_01196 [subsurface metagenome]